MVSPLTGFVPRNPNFEADARASFALHGLMATLGAEVTYVVPGACDIAVAFHPGLSQHHGFFHAGVTSSIADTSAGFAAFTLFQPGASVLTVEFKINLIAPAQGQRMIARGRVEKSGRTLTICRADVVCVQDGIETPVALGLFTLMQVAKPAAPA